MEICQINHMLLRETERRVQWQASSCTGFGALARAMTTMNHFRPECIRGEASSQNFNFIILYYYWTE